MGSTAEYTDHSHKDAFVSKNLGPYFCKMWCSYQLSFCNLKAWLLFASAKDPRKLNHCPCRRRATLRITMLSMLMRLDNNYTIVSQIPTWSLLSLTQLSIGLGRSQACNTVLHPLRSRLSQRTEILIVWRPTFIISALDAKRLSACSILWKFSEMQ